MKYLLCAALLMLAPSAWAETCTCDSGAGTTWTGAAGDGGDTSWSGCTPTADDDWVIEDSCDIEITGVLGASGSPLTGSITVTSPATLSLDADAQATAYHSGTLTFSTGSGGTWRGFELDPYAVPQALSFTTDGSTASPTHITFDFRNFTDPDGDNTDEWALPWTLCDGATEDCDDETEIHQEDTVSSVVYPGTQIYFDFEKYAPNYFVNLSPAGGFEAAFFDIPGMFLEVVDVHDLNSDGTNDAFTVILPATGPDNGHLHFGGDSGEATTGDTDRCEECTDVAGARDTSGDTSGQRLRNAIDEAGAGSEPWQVDATGGAAWSRAFDAENRVRWEIQVDPDTLSADEEFRGFLMCRGAQSGTTDPDEETWCARIIDTEDGGANPDTIVVWRSPEGVIADNDLLNVYYARPFPGDKFIPVNMHKWVGEDSGRIVSNEGSDWGVTTEIAAIHFDEMGGASAGTPIGVLVNELNGFGIDLTLMEHFGFDDATSTAEAIAFQFTTVGNTTTDAEDFSLQRSSCRFADANSDVATGNDGDPAICYRFRAENDATDDATVDTFDAFDVRKLRCEGVGLCVFEHAGYFANSTNGIFAQDVISLHGMFARDNEAWGGRHAYEVMGGHKSADLDRLVLLAPPGGNAIEIRCDGGNTGSLDQCSTDYALTASSLVTSHAGTVSGLFAVGATDTAFYRTTVVNGLLSGDIDLQPVYAYIAVMDHFPDGAQGGGIIGCQDAVGIFAIGGDDIDQYAAGADCDATDTQVIQDNTWLFQNASNATWTQAADDSYPYQTNFIRNLFHCGVGSANCIFYRISDSDFEAEDVVRVDFQSGVHLTDEPGSERGFLFDSDAGDGGNYLLGMGPNYFVGGDIHAHATGSGGTVWATGSNGDNEEAIPTDARALDGDGSDEGWNKLSTGIPRTGASANTTSATKDPRGLTLFPISYPEASLGTACTNSGTCSLPDALPKWSGPVVRDWPFAWATADPIPGFHRCGPDRAYLPKRLEDRMDTFLGGGGGSVWPSRVWP